MSTHTHTYVCHTPEPSAYDVLHGLVQKQLREGRNTWTTDLMVTIYDPVLRLIAALAGKTQRPPQPSGRGLARWIVSGVLRTCQDLVASTAQHDIVRT